MIEAAVENIQAKRKALTEASGLIKGGAGKRGEKGKRLK